MVVVPQGARILVVRILVDVDFTRQDGVLGLTVETRRQVAAVQVGDDALGVAPVIRAVGASVDLEQVAAAVAATTGRMLIRLSGVTCSGSRIDMRSRTTRSMRNRPMRI